MNLIQFTSSYTFDSGTNSIEKQMAGGYRASINPGVSSSNAGGISSPKLEQEEAIKSKLSSDLRDEEKSSIIQYRRNLIKRTKERKEKDKRKLRTRLDKYNKPLPSRIMEDIKREKSIQGNDISPIV